MFFPELACVFGHAIVILDVFCIQAPFHIMYSKPQL